jgi:cysteine desulfurase
MLHFLDSKGIAVSAGSACSSHAKAPSGTLLAFGLTPAEADSTLRISFSRENTDQDVDALVAALMEGVEKLIRIHH